MGHEEIHAPSGIGSFSAFSLAGRQGTRPCAGDYIEARSADVFTGPCFAMSEVSLTGQEAILAWKVREGDWNGVDLNGLSVVAVVRANATLGDPYHDAYPARSILIVDSRATAAQRTALAAFAESMAGKSAGPRGAGGISAHPNDGGAWRHARRGQAGGGPLGTNRDPQPLPGRSPVRQRIGLLPAAGGAAHSMPAFTLDSSFSGQGLGEVWKNVDKRSAFVGSF